MFEAIVTGIISGIVSGIVTGIVLFFLTRWYNKKIGLIERYKCPNPECGKMGLYNGEGGQWCCFCGQSADRYRINEYVSEKER